MRVSDVANWEAFLGVAKQGTFTRAARSLGVPTPQVSRRVAKLEDGLGVRLFHRSTRVVSLTDEGRALLPRVTSILEDLSSIESHFESEKELSGTVRVTCVPFVAHRLLPRVLERFGRDYPRVTIEVELSKEFRNLIESGLDMAIRIETPKDSDLVYRKLAPNDLVLVASPKYLQANAPVEQPSDLAHHRLLMMDIHERVRFQRTKVNLGQFQEARKVRCANGVFLTDLARRGQGILVRSIWDVQEQLKTGELEQVLPHQPLETFGHLYAVIPSKRFLAKRVRFFLDCILEEARTLK